MHSSTIIESISLMYISTLIIINMFYNLNLTINAGLLNNKIKINLLVVERSYYVISFASN
jgi:hypothetical protein